MSRVNDSYLTNLITDLGTEETDCFKTINKQGFNQNKVKDDKLERMIERQAKLLSQLKYNANALKSHLEKMKYHIENPKIKVVGI
jgi:hypothetical protein